MKFIHGHDLQQHASALDGWQQHYQQLTPGKFMGALFDIWLADVRLFREYLNLKVVQHMSLAAPNVNLVIPLQNDILLGNIPTCSGIAVLPYGVQHFSLISGNQMDVLCISLPPARFLSLMPGGAALLTPTGYHITLPPLMLDNLRRQCNAMIHYLQHLPARQHTDSLMALLRDQLLDTLRETLASIPPAAVARLGYTTRHYIVARCHQWVQDGQPGEITPDMLCRQLKISRRTLQYSFQQVTGLSPVAYLRAIRLNLARSSLLNTPAEPVAAIARRAGFHHCGYFASEYGALFGETPSQTRALAAHR
ncbi:helix-turn-helix domain-containing protein [Shimwellia pseudoproteus]|uniref:helix-turn-helix domain-containing protein n=1 Tax=Shimwellia pseudoproteus TaxID=570012 RepID=UPI0018EDC909|nr:helix-turn-helix domain-containing protein [Shimwellia pseudoproteus]MBJ3815852.1 helix-turn-helix domain-containing protein [Shimwellia pseudoproteus]